MAVLPVFAGKISGSQFYYWETSISFKFWKEPVVSQFCDFFMKVFLMMNTI